MSVVSPNPDVAKLDLPSGFLWGASTSAYQIEGAAAEDGRGQSIWDHYCRQPGRVAGGDHGDIACDHYHRYADDIALMRDLGLQAYRFSVAWPRVLPEGRGAANGKGLDFYDRLVDRCLQAGIEPWLCLYHWDLPLALAEQGGWTNREVAGWFADYAELVARRYGDRVRHIATFNEPAVVAVFGHLLGTNAPGLASREAYLSTVHHLNLAHGRAIQVLRSQVPGALLGTVHTLQPVYPCSPADDVAALALDAHWNGAHADPQFFGAYPDALAPLLEPWCRPGDLATIRQRLDWLGVNHYSPLYARCDGAAPLGFSLGEPPPGVERTAIGWPVASADFTRTLVHVAQRYSVPLYVTENGYGGFDAPDDDGRIRDSARIDYLRRYIQAVADAVAEGADVRGYFVWSLLDNFEWSFGYANRFGIVHVDFATQRRTVKDSGHWYRALIAAQSRY